jgi:hypothetical protein
MNQYDLMLAEQHRRDLMREVQEERRAALARAALRPKRVVWHRAALARLGRVMVAWGTRLQTGMPDPV